MFSTRLTFTYVSIVIAATFMARWVTRYYNIKYTSFDLGYVVVVSIITIGAAGATALIARKMGWMASINTRRITEDSLQKILLHMLLSFAFFACAAVASMWLAATPRMLAIACAAIAGLWLFISSMRYITYLAAAFKNPALADERFISNVKKSEKWAFLGCFEAAIILGFIDYSGWVPLSGATVGFSVAFAGIFFGLASQYWLERQGG